MGQVYKPPTIGDALRTIVIKAQTPIDVQDDKTVVPEDNVPEPETKPNKVVIVPPVAGRNDPCPCGSGLKYKKCHVGKPLLVPSHIIANARKRKVKRRNESVQ